jgi:hypothetical protein
MIMLYFAYLESVRNENTTQVKTAHSELVHILESVQNFMRAELESERA